MRAARALLVFGIVGLMAGGMTEMLASTRSFAAGTAAGVCGLPPAPPLSQDQVRAILNPPDARPKSVAEGPAGSLGDISLIASGDLLSREEQYYQLVQRQLLQDAILLFSSPAPATVYAEFNPDDGPPGIDLGYGLKVIKRVEVGDKTIFVNEAWPFQRGHFQLPSEIRIRTRMFYKPGDPQGQEGSEYQYLNGRYRIGWDQADQPHFYEEPGYLKPAATDGEPVQAQRRVRANIYNCMGCHMAGNPFTRLFVTGSSAGTGASPAPIQYESIVQPGYFNLPVEQTRGFQQFMKYIAGQNVSPNELSTLRGALATPVGSFHAADFSQSMVSALCEKLRNNRFDFLNPDQPFTGDLNSLSPQARRDGIYGDAATLWRDSVDAILEGQFLKYTRWIENRGTVPEQ